MMGDQMNQAGQQVMTKNTDTYKCTSCGGQMSFEPRSQVLLCSHCGSKANVEISKQVIKEHNLDAAESTGNINWGMTTRVFHCNNCGAESILEGSNTAQFCAFCGSIHVVRYEEAAGIAPEGLIPFKITRDTAIDNFNKWIKKRFFAPGALRSTYRKQSINGAYIPFWSYSTDSDSSYNAEAGTYYYETEQVTVKKDGKKVQEQRKVRKTRWRRVRGNFTRSFRDHLVNASKQINNRIISRVEPFNLKELIPYAPGFMAGFLAEKYSVGLQEGWEEARKKMDREIEGAVKSHIGADEVRNLSINTSYTNKRYKNLLLPVWLSSYTFKDKIYHFMVNGQSGKVSGDSPVSAGKVIAVIAAVAAVIALLVYLL